MDVILKTFSRHYLYGTYTDASPVNYKVIFIPDTRDILLNTGQERSNTAFPIDESGKIMERIEYTSLRAFFADLVEGGVNPIEILFTTPQKMSKQSETWTEIVRNRDRLVQPNVERLFFNTLKHATLYNDVSQLKEPIQELWNFVQEQSNARNENFCISKCAPFFEQMAEKYPDTCAVTKSPTNLGQANEKWFTCFKIIDTKISYDHRLSIVKQTVDNLYKRFCITPRATPGDWPNLARLYRTGAEFIELAQTGTILFERPDATLLRAILDGQVPVETCQELIARNNAELKSLADADKLPRLDRAWMNGFICSVYAEAVKKWMTSDDLQSNRIHQGHVSECV